MKYFYLAYPTSAYTPKKLTFNLCSIATSVEILPSLMQTILQIKVIGSALMSLIFAFSSLQTKGAKKQEKKNREETFAKAFKIDLLY